MNSEQFFNNIRIFGDPKVPDYLDIESYIKLYIDGLSKYSGEVLDAAYRKMHLTRKHRNFPLLAECIDACKDVQSEFVEQRMAEEGREGGNRKKIDLWSEWRIKQADRMMDSDIGRQAAEENWIVHLHDWCREQGRLPNKFEGEKVRAVGLANKATRDALAAKNPASLRIIAAVANAMAAKAQRLSAIALKQEAA